MGKRSHLTHWGRVTHICVGNLTIIGSGNGLSPGRRQAIIWTNAEILSIGPLGTNFSEISIEINTFSFKKMRLKVSSAKWRPFCLGLNVLSAMSSSINTNDPIANTSLIARFMGPAWGPSGADRTQVGPMLAPWTLLSGVVSNVKVAS